MESIKYPMFSLDYDKWDLFIAVELIWDRGNYINKIDDFYYNHILNKRFVDSNGSIFVAIGIEDTWVRSFYFFKKKVSRVLFEKTNMTIGFNDLKQSLLKKATSIEDLDARAIVKEQMMKAESYEDLIYSI